MSDISDIIDNMDEDDRLLYLSASEVKRSVFWEHMLAVLDDRARDCNQKMITKLMEGDEKAATVNAAMLQAVGWVLEIMVGITQDVEDEALNQEQEESYGVR